VPSVLVGRLGERAADLVREVSEEEARLEAQAEGEGAVEAAQLEAWLGDLDDPVSALVDLGQRRADRGGLADAAGAHDQGGDALGQGDLEAGTHLLVSLCLEEFAGVGGRIEGLALEAEVLEIHGGLLS